MKKLILFIFLCMGLVALSQNKEEISILENTRSLHQAVFIKKDSVRLNKLFADKITYGHSSGKIESKNEAIRNIVRNLSTYDDLAMSPVSLWIEGNTAITRYQMSANEKAIDGKINPLKLHILLVWIKDKNEWRVLSRQAVKVN